MNPFATLRPTPFSPAPRLRRGGFTLIELMVALSLAAILTLGIMQISNTAREVYQSTVRKVDLANKFKLALMRLDGDFSNWIETSNLEFYVDGAGAGARRNRQWDEGEELPDKADKNGPGVLDGGLFKDYDEFAGITERHYFGVDPGLDPAVESNRKIHSAFQAYFRTLTYVDGKLREANVEYMLVDPNNRDPFGNMLPPKQVLGENLAGLLLVKVVRFHRMSYEDLTKQQNFDIRRSIVEIASNITDFKIEYTVDNRFYHRGQETAVAFVTPSQDAANPFEKAVAPKAERGEDGETVYRKVFGYGSNKIRQTYERGTGFRGVFGDRQGQSDHRPPRFGFQGTPEIQFAELVQGSKIFVFTESSRGEQARGGAPRAIQRNRFPSGLYTVKSNLGGQLEFYEDISSVEWEGNQTPLYYKAAFLPTAVRITLRIVDDKATPESAKTMTRVIWTRRKAR